MSGENEKQTKEAAIQSQPSISACFYVACPKNFDPQLVTAAAGVEPTEIWRCKPHISIQNPDLDKMSWNYDLEDLPLIEYSAALNRIVDIFWPRREQLSALAETHNLQLGCMLVPRGSTRDFVPVISESVVRKLADLGASLSISHDRFN